MKLFIALKDSAYKPITIEDFQKVSYFNGQSFKEITNNDFAQLNLSSQTFNFIGKSTVSIVGTDILYLKLED